MQSTRRVLSIFFVCIIVGFMFTSCGENEKFPVYNGVIRQLSDREVIKYDPVQPYFGDQLQRVNGDYYIVKGSIETVSNWYQSLVADQQLIYVDSLIQPTRHMLLFDFPRNFKQKGEVDIIRIDDNRSLLILYKSIDVNDQITGNSGWFVRTWGWLMGFSGQSGFEALYELAFTWITPLHDVYQAIYLEPVLNLYIVLRSLFPWYFLWIILLHSFIVSLCFGIITDPITKLIMWIIPKSSATSADTISFISIFRSLTSFFISFFFGALLSLAIWQTLSALFNMDTSARTLIIDHSYSWIPAHMLQLSLVPPDGEFLGTPFNKPNVILVPICMFVISLITYIINIGVASTVNDMIRSGMVSRTQFSEEALFAVDITQSGLKDDPLAVVQNVLGESIKTAAPLAFMPIGVAMYFIFEHTKSLYKNIISFFTYLSLLEKDRVAYKRVVFTQNAVKVSVILGFCWLGYGTFTQVYASVPQSLITSITAPTPQPTIENTRMADPTPEIIMQETVTTLTYGTVTTTSLRVRAQPNTQSTVLAGVQRDQQLHVVGITADELWFFIEYQQSKYGWVSSAYVNIDNHTSLTIFDAQSAQEFIDAQP